MTSQSGLTLPTESEAQARSRLALRAAAAIERAVNPDPGSRCLHPAFELNHDKTRCLACGEFLEKK